MKRLLVVVWFACSAFAQAPFSSTVRGFITVDAPAVALTHVRVIDGTGGPARENQTIVIAQGKIQAAGDAAPPAGAKVLDLGGYTVIPGLVGMHDHLFYPTGVTPVHYSEDDYSAPRMYLAGGVTSIRTTGSLDGYTDLSTKRAIDSGRQPGPHIFPTAPYLEGGGAYTPQMHELSDASDAQRLVAYWAEEGMTNFKAYMHITRAELSAAIEEAHKRGLKITGHLCSIGFREAAALGIDDLEHGLVVDTEFTPGKQADQCPDVNPARASLMKVEVNGPEIQQTIKELVAHHVAVTSTLPVFETFVPNRPPFDTTGATQGPPRSPNYLSRVLESMSPEARDGFLTRRAQVGSTKESPWPVLFRKEMDFEYAFAKAGGLLLAGLDPTGYGGVVPGFGDWREVELLVEAGFTPVEAIKVATLNGAHWLGIADRVGTIAPGKNADLVVIKGDPSKNITDIEKVETVFKDGIGYDSAKLMESARGQVGLH